MTASENPPKNGHAPLNGNHAAAGDGAPSEPEQAPDFTPASRASRLLDLTAPTRLEVPWLKVTIACLVIAGVLTLWLRGAPTYDPWAWIIWGREIIHGDLVTTDGPSWKPLPMVFTIPFAFFGKAAPDLWMWVARAIALIGIVAVSQLAARLGGRLAAALAAIATACAPLYYAYGVQGSSEGMLVLACALAATSWLDGRRTHAFWWLVAAALLRPEAWPFVALAGLERLRDRPQRIWWIGLAALVVVAAWLIPEKIGSGAFMRAAERAHTPNPESSAFAKSPTLDVLGSMANLLLWVPISGVIAALLLGIHASRKPPEERIAATRVLLDARFLGLLSLGWIAIVCAMTEGGYAGNPRYLAAPLALLIAVALGGLAWLVRWTVRLNLPSAGELLVVAALVSLVLVAGLRLPARTEEITWQSENRRELAALAADPGLRRDILRCGPVITHPLMVPPFAWSFGLHIDDVKSLVPLRGGTYVIGTNAASRGVQPEVPAEAKVTPITDTAQIRIVSQGCEARSTP